MKSVSNSCIRTRARALLAAAGALGAISLTAWSPALAYNFTTLYTFCAEANCADGSFPSGGLFVDASGNLFGTTSSGGAHSGGTVYELIPNADRTKWKHKVVYDFCSDANCSDGGAPYGQLIADSSGNLYGTTFGGTVYELRHSGGHWRLKTLYRFCTVEGCPDGKWPGAGLTYQGAASGVPYDGVSPLYSTAISGGAHGRGVVYQLESPAAGKKRWKEKVAYSFCAQSNCSDGADPSWGLLMDASGNLYGTIYQGGYGGVAFELSPNARKTKWAETVLYSFCQLPDCSDGIDAWGELIMDSAGDLLGITGAGGANHEGVLYKLVPNGANSQETVLYNFCSQTDCADGARPMAALLMDSSGNLFGTASESGHLAQDIGTVFEFSGSILTTLHTFCSLPSCGDGASPVAPLSTDQAGDLFGVALNGGANRYGTAFALTP